MSTINQQPLADPLLLSDLIAVWSSGNSDTRRASLTALLALIQANIAFPSLNPAGQVTFLPFIGGTNTIIASTAATVTLPAAPVFGQTVEFIAVGTNTGPVTLQVTSLGGAQATVAVKYKNAALIGGEIVAGGSAMAIFDGVAYQLVASAVPAPAAPAVGNSGLIGGYLTWTVAGNALTLAVKADSGNDPSVAEPVYYQVRSATAGDGKMTLRTLNAALSLVIPNGALLGTVSTVPFRLWATIFNDAGVDRLAVINCVTTVAGAGTGRDVTTIYPLGQFEIGTSIAVSAAANSAGVFYTNTGVASKAYGTIGYASWETGLATAGAWSANPTRIQLFGHGVPLPGAIVQKLRTDTGALSTGTTITPYDDTIPQIGEGDQYMSQAATPSSAANIFGVASEAEFATSITGTITMALHQDAVANAISAKSMFGFTGGGAPLPLRVDKKILAATTAAVTFRIRAGTSGAGTTTFNGFGGARALGGANNSFIEVTEIQG